MNRLEELLVNLQKKEDEKQKNECDCHGVAHEAAMLAFEYFSDFSHYIRDFMDFLHKNN